LSFGDGQRATRLLDAGSIRQNIRPWQQPGREMRDVVRGENLAWFGHGTQTGGEVERCAPIPALRRYRFTGIESHADADRERRLRVCRGAQAALELDRRAKRLPCRAEHAQRLIPPQLQQLALKLRHRLLHQVGEPAGKGRRGVVAMLLREPRVAAHVREQERADIRPRDQRRRRAKSRVFDHDPPILRPGPGPRCAGGKWTAGYLWR